MEKVCFVKFHQIEKSILNSVVCKLHITEEPFDIRVNLVDLPVSCFPKPLMVVCHKCGVFDLYESLSNYNEEEILNFIREVKRIYNYYMSEENDIWWYYENNKDIDKFVYFEGGNRYCISEELTMKIWSRRYIRSIREEIEGDDFQLYKRIIEFVCFMLKWDYEGFLFDILVDYFYAMEQYLIKRVHEVFGIPKQEIEHMLKDKLGSKGFCRSLQVNNRTYFINLIYKRFGSFEPVTVCFRKHYNKTNIYLESYYNRSKVDDIVEIIKAIEDNIVQWDKQEIRKFVETSIDSRFSSEPSIQCQLIARKYITINNIQDDKHNSRYLSLTLLIIEILEQQTSKK